MMSRLLALAASVLALGAADLAAQPVSSYGAAQASAFVLAQADTATFAIENMTCALCPVTVKSAMEQVDGVRSVAIDFEAKTATVVFDPAVATADAIAAASRNAGYPAAAIQGRPAG